MIKAITHLLATPQILREATISSAWAWSRAMAAIRITLHKDTLLKATLLIRT